MFFAIILKPVKSQAHFCILKCGTSDLKMGIIWVLFFVSLCTITLIKMFYFFFSMCDVKHESAWDFIWFNFEYDTKTKYYFFTIPVLLHVQLYNYCCCSHISTHQ